MNPYTKEEWRTYEHANKERRNRRRREIYKLKKGEQSIEKRKSEKVSRQKNFQTYC